MLSAFFARLLLFSVIAPSLSSQQSQPSSQQTNTASPQPSTPKPCSTAAPSSSNNKQPCVPARKHHKKSPSQAKGSATNSTIVVHNGGTADPIVAISPSMTEQQTSQELSTTNRLLANAEANLKQLFHRSLSSDEEDTVKQIEVYMQQARTAVKNGESQRAYMLASKADMLSADLARPRR